MNQEIFQKLDREFFERIENTGIENGRRLMVLFSGVPCSGKTELAKKIKDEFGGMLISKDMARNLIYKYKGFQITPNKSRLFISDTHYIAS